MEDCVIFYDSERKLIQVTECGRKSLIEYSTFRRDEEVFNRLVPDRSWFVYEESRKCFNNKKRISSENLAYE